MGSRTAILELLYKVPYGDPIEVRAAVLVTTSTLSGDDVATLMKVIETNIAHNPVHIAMVFHTGSVEPDARSMLDQIEKRLHIKVVEIPIERIFDRIQLAAVGRAIYESLTPCANILAHLVENGLSVASNILDEDEARDRLIDLWRSLGVDEALNKALHRPLVIEELKLEPPLKRYEDIASVMKIALTSKSDIVDVKQLFDYVQHKIMRFHLYGSKRGVLSLDIESPDKLLEYLQAVADLGFVSIRGDGDRVLIDLRTLSDYERRVIDILTNVFKGRPVEDTLLRKFFVSATKNFDKVWSTILSILESRGMICIGTAEKLEQECGIRVSTSGNRSTFIVEISRTNARSVARLWIDSVRNIVEHELSLPHIKKIGYVVCAKERGYRAYTVLEMLNTIKSLIEDAEKALGLENARALRLARLAKELTSYYLEYVKPLIENAHSSVKKIIDDLERIVRDSSKLIKDLEHLLTKYIARNGVVIRLRWLEDLSRRLDEAKKVMELEIDHDRFAKEVEELWLSFRSRSRRSASSFPFYYQNRMYMFNYKLWKITQILDKFIRYGEDGWSIVPELEENTSRLRSLVDHVKSIIERMNLVANRKEKLVSALRGLGIREPKLIQSITSTSLGRIDIGKIDVDNVVELEARVKSLLERWEKELEAIESNLDTVVKSIDGIQRLTAKLKETVSAALDELAKYKRISEDDVCRSSGDSAKRKKCLEALEVVDRDLESLSKLEDIINIVISTITSVSTINELSSKLQNLYTELNDKCDRIVKDLEELRSTCKEYEASLVDEVRRSVRAIEMLKMLVEQYLPAEVEQFNKIVEDAYEVLQNIETRNSDVCSAIREIDALQDKARRFIVGRLMEDKEVSIYLELNSLRSRGTKLSLREAIEIVSKKLAMDRDEVKRVALRLIDKGLIEVYL